MSVPSSSHVECPFCLDELDEFIELSCGHKYCKECLIGWFTSQIDDRRLEMVCDTCRCPVEGWVLEALLPPDLLEKYSKFSLDKLLETEFNLFYCPVQTCKNIVEAALGSRHVKCPECKTEFCMECKTEWHKGATCAKYQEWALENKNADALTMNFLKGGKGTKRCPNCNVWVEKNGGCDHMTCKRCSHHFWWSTLEPYPRGKSAWTPDNSGVIQEDTDVPPRRVPRAPPRAPTDIPPRRTIEEIRASILRRRTEQALNVSYAADRAAVDAASHSVELAARAAAASRAAYRAERAAPDVPTIDEVHQLFLTLSAQDQAEFFRRTKTHAQTAEVPEGPYTRERMMRMTVVQLRALCRHHHLFMSGTKSVIIDRILESGIEGVRT